MSEMERAMCVGAGLGVFGVGGLMGRVTPRVVKKQEGEGARG